MYLSDRNKKNEFDVDVYRNTNHLRMLLDISDDTNMVNVIPINL